MVIMMIIFIYIFVLSYFKYRFIFKLNLMFSSDVILKINHQTNILYNLSLNIYSKTYKFPSVFHLLKFLISSFKSLYTKHTVTIYLNKTSLYIVSQKVCNNMLKTPKNINAINMSTTLLWLN